MEKIFERALLYDFYGELLTTHQRSIYEEAVFNDMSLSEIADEQGISRQGVHDLLKRCDRILQDYESKLHLVERFSCAREKIKEIVDLTMEQESTMDFGRDTAGMEEEKSAGREVCEAENGREDAGRCREARRFCRNEHMQRIKELALELLEEW